MESAKSVYDADETAMVRDLMRKIGDDVSDAIFRTLALTAVGHLPLVMSAGAVAAGIIAAIIDKQSAQYDKYVEPSERSVLLAGLLIGRIGAKGPHDAISAAYRDLKIISPESSPVPALSKARGTE